jgi:hypothetical protein
MEDIRTGLTEEEKRLYVEATADEMQWLLDAPVKSLRSVAGEMEPLDMNTNVDTEYRFQTKPSTHFSRTEYSSEYKQKLNAVFED